MEHTRRGFFASLFIGSALATSKTVMPNPEILKGRGETKLGLGDYVPGRFVLPQNPVNGLTDLLQMKAAGTVMPYDPWRSAYYR